MKIAVFGTGYVGLVTSVCFSEMGNFVHCVDIDLQKIESLKQGKSPIYEPGLENLLVANSKAGRLHFTNNAKSAVEFADIIFIAVGTPSLEDGSADLQHVLKVADTIAENMASSKLIVTKSTVPVGTHKEIRKIIENRLSQRNQALSFDVASNPEFLREGSALEDCLKPNRVVIGVDSQTAHEQLQNLYDPFLKNGNPLLAMDLSSAEMTKYAANAMLAAKISLMNEFSRVCEKLGADIESVRKGIGSDFRIGPHFIYAGIGYGGSCFPKDVKALIKIGKDVDEELMILSAVEKTNQLQRDRFIQLIEKRIDPACRKLALWGISFKPGTDDIRAAPALDIVAHFLTRGFTVHIYDPVAAESVRRFFGDHKNLLLFEDQYAALSDAGALVLSTEWKSFREPDFQKMKSLLRSAVIFDGRNIYNPRYIRQQGFTYYSIGRPQ